MGSNSNITEVYERIPAGLGDGVMLRPAIVANMSKKPRARHVLHIWEAVSRIFNDIDGLEIVPLGGEEGERYDKSRRLLRGYNKGNLYELSSPGLQYETSVQPHVNKSRQEIFCDVVGVPFSKSSYRVTFSESEEQFARHFVCGMDNPIGIHVRASQWYRDYEFIKLLVEYFAKKYDGTVVTFDDKYIHNTRKTNIASLAVPNYRLSWAVMSKMNILVGPDSFGIHAAGSAGVPVYGLFGPTDPRCRLKYENAAWLDSYSTCGRQYCWYKPCRQISCLSTRLPGFLWDDIVAKLGSFLDRDGDGGKPWGRYDSVAVVRMRGIGDVLMSLPAVAKQREGMSAAHGSVTYVTGPDSAPLVESSGLVDKVVSVEYKHETTVLSPLPPGVDFSKYDKVYNLINVFDYAPFSDRVDRSKLAGDCLDTDVNGIGPPILKVPDSWLRGAEELLGRNNISGNKPFIALQVDSDGESRRWPRRRQEEFLRLVYKKGREVVLLSDRWQNYSHSEVVNLTGQTDIETYVGAIALCGVFVGSDSSGVHIAGCLGKKAIALYGSVDPKLRISYYPTVKAIVGKARCVPCNDWGIVSCEKWKKSVKCMWSIKARKVYRQVEKMLKNDGR